MKTGSASGLKGLQSDAQSPAEGQALLAYLRLALRDLILLNIFISDLDSGTKSEVGQSVYPQKAYR